MVLCEYDAGPAVFNDLEVMNKMRGLLNHNIAAFESENDYGFPEIFPVTERVSCDHWIDFDPARRTLKPGAKRPQPTGQVEFTSTFRIISLMAAGTIRTDT